LVLRRRRRRNGRQGRRTGGSWEFDVRVKNLIQRRDSEEAPEKENRKQVVREEDRERTQRKDAKTRTRDEREEADLTII
jgi:hypothetical protein